MPQDSAYHRSTHPKTWWITPEVQFLSGILYALEGANWQRGGGKGPQPKPTKFPSDRTFETHIQDSDELNDLKRRRREMNG